MTWLVSTNEGEQIAISAGTGESGLNQGNLAYLQAPMNVPQAAVATAAPAPMAPPLVPPVQPVINPQPAPARPQPQPAFSAQRETVKPAQINGPWRDLAKPALVIAVAIALNFGYHWVRDWAKPHVKAIFSQQVVNQLYPEEVTLSPTPWLNDRPGSGLNNGGMGTIGNNGSLFGSGSSSNQRDELEGSRGVRGGSYGGDGSGTEGGSFGFGQGSYGTLGQNSAGSSDLYGYN